ncbi:MAG: hypothetical protein AABM31_08560, partial [Actinomycetota bacterium]
MSRRLRIPCGEGGQALVLVLGLAAALWRASDRRWAARPVISVSFPQGFAPTRVSVRVRGDVHVRVAGSRRGEALRRVVVR